MRKLKLQVQISIDGFIAGPTNEMDWMAFEWDDELKHFVSALTEPVDCIVLGRNLAEGFIPYWASVAADRTNPEYEAGRTFTDTHKVVFTKTLGESAWPNTVLAKGDLVDEITTLKKQAGQDIIVYGGAQFVSSLIQNNLIDDLYLFVSPVALGKGLAIFADRTSLNLVEANSFACGIVVQHYQPVQG